MSCSAKAQQKFRAAAIAKGAAAMAEIHSRPGMEESYAEWKKEYDATVAMHTARRFAARTRGLRVSGVI